MKNKNLCDTAQSAYLLEYGKRKIKVCADTFQNLAQIFGEEEQEEDETSEDDDFEYINPDDFSGDDDDEDDDDDDGTF